MFLSTRSASALLVFALVVSAHAQADNVTFFRTTIHNQTGATSADELGTFLATGISVTDAGNYSAATLYLPDGTTTYPLSRPVRSTTTAPPSTPPQPTWKPPIRTATTRSRSTPGTIPPTLSP